MKLLVTGASGLLGSNLALEFRREGHQVVALYYRHAFRVPGVESVACDLTDRVEMSRVVAKAQPDCVVNCAAATNLEWCEAHPVECLRINAETPIELAGIARARRAGMVHISTDAVFDGVAGGYGENDAPSPVNCYAESKSLGEAGVLGVMPRALVLRTNIYGWNLQPKTSLAEWILSLLQNGSTVPGFRDVVFSPVLVNHLATWILELIATRQRGIFHAASSDYISKYGFARQLAEVFGFDPALVLESSLAESSLTTERPRNTWLRAEKLSAALGRPLPSIREGVDAFRALGENGFAEQLRSAAA
jgi:dTDP-4-dehydrorhamnose reductase